MIEHGCPKQQFDLNVFPKLGLNGPWFQKSVLDRYYIELQNGVIKYFLGNEK